jgi:membrane associated rhomboid family serine protease
MTASIDPLWWECIRRDEHPLQIEDARLVLTAVDIDYRIHREDDHWCLYVPRGLGTRALAELERYRAENVRPPRPSPAQPPVDRGFAGALGFLLVIWLLPTLEAWAPFGLRLRDAGCLDADAFRAGEWWRAITALTLHADLGHLLGNSVFGAVLGILVARRVGSGVGWFLVVVCAALGNAINASIQPSGFVSIGASTATFAALGLAAFASVRPGRGNGDWRRHLAPVAAALALLAFTGIEGERTDILAHLFGFAIGSVCGHILARLDGAHAGVRRVSRRLQRIAAATTVTVIAAAWLLASFSGPT